MTSWLTVGISAQATGIDEEVDFPIEGWGAIMTGDWFTVTMGAYSAGQNRHINVIHKTVYCVKE